MTTDGLSPVGLSTFGLCRQSPRAVERREPGYDEKYDADTMFFDVVRSADGRHITAPGPPLLNGQQAVLEGTFRLGEHGPALTPRYVCHVNGGTTRWDAPATCPTDANELWITINGRTARVPIQPSGSAAFAGKRVLMTMSRDNHPRWLRDWATFHARMHGTNALIVYDNDSSRYTIEQLRQALEGIDGIASLVVMPWPYSFGPGKGPRGEYDSNYSQMGAIADARWRFAESAEAFLFTDSDELVLSMDGSSVYDHLRDSDLPCVTFAGRWVSAVRPIWQSRDALPPAAPLVTDDPPVLHTDCVYRTRQSMYLNKWVASPARCGDQVQWTLHCVIGLPEALGAHDTMVPMTRAFETRHCVQISTSWNYRRGHPQRYLPHRHRFDRAFAQALSRAFPQQRVHRVWW